MAFGRFYLPGGFTMHVLAEFGVVLLMFTIGLEFSLPRLLVAKRLDVERGAIRVPGRLLDTRSRAGDVLLLKGGRGALEKVTACLVEGN